MDLFGWEIQKKKKDTEDQILSFTPEEKDDGATVVAPGGAMGVYVDLEGAAKNEAELITKYRTMYNQPECQGAVDKICNEAIVKQPDKPVCEINLDALDNQSQKVKDAISKEWRTCVELLNLNNDAYNIFQRWYVDSRLPYQVLIDVANPREGIKELRYTDPRKLRKVRTTKPKRVKKAVVFNDGEEFFIFNEKGFKNNNTNAGNNNTGLKISADSMIYVTSGLMDENNTMVIGYLHKAIKPLNQLRMLEDSAVIARVSRAAERRAFYIDVGNLPKAKAEQYLRDMMVKHKNRLVYDQTTGEVRDDRKYQTMYEDMWFPTRGGQSGTKVETLPGLQNNGMLEDVQYFKGKLFEALNLPMSRLEQGSGTFNLGRSSEISRDELEFQKFIDRLRTRFATLFLDVLGKQLVLKGIITVEDWEDFRNKITFDFARDNYYAELKDAEILRERIELLGVVDDFDGKYFSREWAQKEILKMTDEEIKTMNAQMEKERKNDTDKGVDQSTYLDFDSEQPDTPGQPEEPQPFPPQE